MGKILKQQEHKLSKEEIKNISDTHINKNVTNADIFNMTRDFYGSALEQNTKLTNIGELYWSLIEKRDEVEAA